MSDSEREFFMSSNGDKWFLDHDESVGEDVVIHRANLASGGAEARWSVPSFLDVFGDHPQGQAVRRIQSNSSSIGGNRSEKTKPDNQYPWTVRQKAERD